MFLIIFNDVSDVLPARYIHGPDTKENLVKWGDDLVKELEERHPGIKRFLFRLYLSNGQARSWKSELGFPLVYDYEIRMSLENVEAVRQYDSHWIK